MKCFVCEDEWPDEEGGLESFVDHMRVMHPDMAEEPERWPDGTIVIHDEDITPEDIIGGEKHE